MNPEDRGPRTEDRDRRSEPNPPGRPSVLRFLLSAFRPPSSGVRYLASGVRPLSSVLCLPAIALATAGLLSQTGCLSPRHEALRPGRTTLGTPLVVLPAQNYGDCLVVEVKWDRYGPYRFLIDTNSSVTLVSPDLAKRYAVKNAPPPFNAPQVHVQSAEGGTVLLAATTLRRLELGEARFDDVPALIYDCAALSAHFGVKIDGILGFPLFRETLLTLDYPRTRVLLKPVAPAPLLPGTTIPFNNDSRTPLIPIRLGDTTFIALIDSGSTAALSLNPVGLQPVFAAGPRPGPIVSTLSGDHASRVGRLADTLMIGGYALPRPLVEVTDELSSIGGEVLMNFTVTFDQERGQVTFYRESPATVTFEPRRSTGVSFSKTPVYWRVVGVVPDSPATAAHIQPGDLVTRINGEPVVQWDLRRFEELVATARTLTFTFLNGTQEHNTTLPVFDLVP